MSDPVAELRAADEAYREVEAEIESVGEGRVEAVAEVRDRFTDLLDRYEESATGSGREVFQSYVEFEGKVAEFEEDLPEDLPHGEAFERACERLDRRRLNERDFERAREDVAPAAEVADLLSAREDARERYREARRAVARRIAELDDRIAELEETLGFADADFDAPVGDLRGPIEAYDDAVLEAFASFKAEAPAREVLALVEATEAYPLVPFDDPPEELRSHLREAPAGEEPIPTLLEYADYSFSKLEHYVEDPREFGGRVGANRTYLERLDGEPLTVGWPPPSAERLRFRVRELVAVVDRFAPESVVSRLRDLRALSRRDDYARLRDAARAERELDEEERERLRSGEVERDLERAREERDRLADALESYPER